MTTKYFILALGLLTASGCAVEDRADDVVACLGVEAASIVWIPGGSFVMGADPQYPEEGPPREVSVSGFWMDSHEVTNAEFAAFVEATNYVTLAERDPPAIPGAPPEMQKPGSAVFNIPTNDDPRWWRWSVGAQWRAPVGETGGAASGGTSDSAKPVVQVAYDDALAYAEWAGKSLPSEAQWEYAAQGGSEATLEPVNAQGAPIANYYQGVFPARDLGADGYTSRSPVGCYPPNAFGLYDMIGNVWEWTGTEADRADTIEPARVIKGGSFLCAANYCARYRPAARQFQERGLGTDHIGFRTVDNNKLPPLR